MALGAAAFGTMLGVAGIANVGVQPPGTSETIDLTPASLPPNPARAVMISYVAGAASPPAGANSSLYVIRYTHWSAADERGFGEFVHALGRSGCSTINSCLHGPANPFRASDPPGFVFRADCADFPYLLRAYYAWKQGLPFSYESRVSPRGHTRDLRYTPRGNRVTKRTDVLTDSTTGYRLLETLRNTISSATYRIGPDLDRPLPPDQYSPAITRKSIHAGTLIYDPNGHVATVWRVGLDGRIHYIASHTDESVTRGIYDQRFVRARPAMGAGFRNWRPVRLVGARRRADGALVGGHMVLAPNRNISDFSSEQYFGTDRRPADNRDWRRGKFMLNGEAVDYYDFVRATLAGGTLEFDPLKELAEMVASNCTDLHYRVAAVDVAIMAGIEKLPEPQRLPPNIYGTEGIWEIYSTPSRDARLKTAFKETRDQVARFVRLYRAHDPKIVYRGHDLVGDLLRLYDARTAQCRISYTRSDGSTVNLGYEQARRRLFAMSFDPYQCAERRWGATKPAEFATCKDGPTKRAWYRAEQRLRNQIDRTYEARMDFTLAELRRPGPGRGVAKPPDTDVRGFLLATKRRTGPVR